MSDQKSATVTCPRCGHRQNAPRWLSINASLDPHLKKELLSGRLTTVTCANCNNVSSLQYSLLYHDMAIPAAIWLVYPRDDMQEAMNRFLRIAGANHKLRVVHSMSELIEKVAIFDSGLNDYVIQLLKIHFLENDDVNLPGPWFFGSVAVEHSEKSFVFWSPSTNKGATIPMSSVYDDLTAKIIKIDPRGQWMHVDNESALQLIQSVV